MMMTWQLSVFPLNRSSVQPTACVLAAPCVAPAFPPRHNNPPGSHPPKCTMWMPSSERTLQTKTILQVAINKATSLVPRLSFLIGVQGLVQEQGYRPITYYIVLSLVIVVDLPPENAVPCQFCGDPFTENLIIPHQVHIVLILL